MARIGAPLGRPIGAALEDNWWNRVGPESHWGITPEMRSRMNQDQAREAALENRYAGAAAAGANPVQLALMDPFRHFQRTGQSLTFMGTKNEPVFFTPGQGEQTRVELETAGSAIRAKSALESALMLEEVSNRYDPISQAIRGMTSQEKERVARVKTGYTEVFGEPGVVPGKAEQQEKIARIAAEPGAAETKEKARQFDILGPTREEEIATKKATRELLKPEQQRLKAITDTITAYSRIAQTTMDPNERQAIMEQIAELENERRTLVGVQGGAKATVKLPADIDQSFPPARHAGKVFEYEDDEGRISIWKSDGKKWNFIRVQPNGGVQAGR